MDSKTDVVPRTNTKPLQNESDYKVLWETLYSLGHARKEMNVLFLEASLVENGVTNIHIGKTYEEKK